MTKEQKSAMAKDVGMIGLSIVLAWVSLVIARGMT